MSDKITRTAKLARDLEQSFNAIGSSMMSNDFAAKLLAYVYVCGGSNEVITHHESLVAGINIAQSKFNIFGGEIPKAEGIFLIQKYAKELQNALKNKEKCEWISEIENKYNLKLRAL